MEIYGMTGERLGTIGQAGPSEEEIPQWQRAFLSKPSVSIRRGIAYNYAPPSEPSSTLVLTSRSGTFIDIRFPMTNHDPVTHQRIPIHENSIFWAFSGTSTTSWIISAGRTNVVEFSHSAHVQWQHDLDSKGPGINDEADMFLLPNGDTMEVGFGPQPSVTGHEEKVMYKEYWTEPLPAKSVRSAAPGTSDLAKVPAIVAETIQPRPAEGSSTPATRDLSSQKRTEEPNDHRPQIQGRGIMIRVGDHIQALYIASPPQDRPTNDTVHVERWTRDSWPSWTGGAGSTSDKADGNEDHDADGEDWYKDPRSNTRDRNKFPCHWLMRDYGRLQVGDEVQSRAADGVEVRWRVSEVYRG